MTDPNLPARSHRQCWTDAGYVHQCQKPTGKECTEPQCHEPAGTWWTPYWCPDCDVTRQDRISEQLRGLLGIGGEDVT